MPINKDAELPRYIGATLKSGTSAQQRLIDIKQTAKAKRNAKKYSKSQALQPKQRDLKMRYRRKRKRKAPKRLGAYELHHDHSEKSRKLNASIAKKQRELRDNGYLKTSYGAQPDELSG